MKNNVRTFFVIFWSVITVALIVLLAFLIKTNNPTPFALHFGNHVEETSPNARNLNETYTIDDVNKVKAQLVALDVTVKKSSDDKCRISVRTNQQNKIAISKTGDTISVIEDGKDGWNWFHFGFNTYGTCTIEVPESYNKDLDLKTVSGEMSLEGDYKLDNVTINSVSGDVRKGSIVAKKVNAKTVSGEIKLDNVEAPCSFATTSGDIEVSSLTGSLDSKSISGGVKANFKKLTGNIDASSVSGDVKITLPEDSDIRISCDSTSGDVDTNFSTTSSGKHHKDVTVGSGSKYSGSIHTTSGDMDITKA